MFSSSQTVSNLLYIREWEKAQLPSPKSALAYELFLLVAHHTLSETPLTLDQLFLSMDYTETAIRRQLNTLIAGAWCELVAGNSDKRLKHVVATQKMIDLIDKYGLLFCDLLLQNISAHKKQLTKKAAP